MFCFQCQETAKNSGCTIRGVCGKPAEVAQMQDLLIWVLKGLALAVHKSKPENSKKDSVGLFISKALFATITNANFDLPRIEELVTQALKLRNEIYPSKSPEDPECLTWQPKNGSEYALKAPDVGVLSNSDEDSRSLKELVVYGLKGIAAYVEHAAMLGKEDSAIWGFFIQTLGDLTKPLTVDELVNIVLQTGNTAVTAMALLDKANTDAYGNPEITNVNLDVGSKPGILVSGHDLKDFEELLIQSENQGIDIYTHSEMLPANAYPAFKKYKHFHGNYGSSWWHQDKEFESFHGPILMTTNCIVPVKDSYKARLFTTGMAGYPGCTHIPERSSGGKKDFSALIKLAKTCPSPESLETGTLTVGFAHHQVLALADKVVEAVKSGAIKKFIVMAGCDGRQKDRTYFTDVAQGLPDNTIILTAGCAKYRYNKLSLGDIGGIPRVLDAGQCNDSYSLALIALKLKEVFGLEDVNQLPLAFDIAWYEQKAVAVLLALLSLGFKNIRLGPTLPAFLSPTVVSLLVKNFGIQGINTAEEDLKALTV